MEWHQANVGHPGHPAAHALKLLEEAVELCVASGASANAIISITKGEVDKAQQRQQFNRGGRPNEMAEEFSDVAICLIIAAFYARVSLDEEVLRKLPVLKKRAWAPNRDGTLRRPGRQSLRYDV
jgi:NTP pyrophosphatase (non-canonical NTP hydrolase)